MHSSRGRRLALLRTVLLMAAAGCAATPTAPVQGPDERLAEAEARFAAKQPEAALAIVEAWDRTTVPARLLPRYDVVQARALFALDRGFEAFEVLRDFYRDSPRSDLRPTAVELQWQIGKYLIGTGRSFWIFYSDRRAGKTVLEHLVTNHSDSPELADGLKTLGDLAYEDRDFTLAQERFRELLRWRPESEWVIYARFRFAMSLVESLQGPDYDLDRMEHAERELREFLAAGPENPDFVAAATGSLDKIREWQAARHLQIAHFYRTVDNPPGCRLHLQIASEERYAGTAANAQARAELGLPQPATEPGQ